MRFGSDTRRLSRYARSDNLIKSGDSRERTQIGSNSFSADLPAPGARADHWKRASQPNAAGGTDSAAIDDYVTVEHTARGDAIAVLSGPVIDRAALFGILNRIRDLG
jgi:hypothetical protein